MGPYFKWYKWETNINVFSPIPSLWATPPPLPKWQVLPTLSLTAELMLQQPYIVIRKVTTKKIEKVQLQIQLSMKNKSCRDKNLH